MIEDPSGELPSEEIAADDIGGGFIPVPRPQVAGVEIDGEEVLLEEGTRNIHWLNQIGSVVWASYDGSTLDQIARELSDIFGADPDLVKSDVLELTRQIGRVGLLEGVAAEIRPQPTGPEGLSPGTLIPDFELPDLEGRTVTLKDFRGEQLLLVNWSPRCGFCDRIVPDLADLQSELREQGVRLLLLAIGSAEDNRLQLEGHGLGSTVLLQDDIDVNIFQNIGTPAAYLVDADGQIASEIAVGALDVPVLARKAAGGDGIASDEG